MNRIHVLDSAVAGKIAAGEVVTNPASVVKELVENAIDAGSTAVTVEIKNGGKSFIRVTDNGGGIYPEDVLLAVQKHATSKIANFEDMERISSLGFRGEALPSIAAVSRLAIKTRVSGETEGCILSQSENGFAVKPAGLPDGTTVLVEDLFYNVPARLKFLRSAVSEASAISDLVSRLALSHPEISFKYISNDNLQFQSPGTGLLDALTAVYGNTVRSRVLEVAAGEGEVRVSGFISNPNYLFKSAKNQTLLVNGRYVRSKKIADALSRAYGDRLLKGHYPFAVLEFAIPHNRVDVNVHPSKTSVLIQGEDEVLNLLDAAVKAAIQNISLPQMHMPQAPAVQTKAKREPEILRPVPYEAAEASRTVYPEPRQYGVPALSVRESALPAYTPPSAYTPAPAEFIPEAAEPEIEEQQIFAAVDDLIDYTVIGQIFGTYVLVQSGEAAYIIDQHAAHERMNYERLKALDTLLPQKLLIPYALKLSQADHDLLLGHADFLSGLGFGIEDFGAGTIKITSLPLRQDQGDVQALLEDVIDILQSAGRQDVSPFRDKIVRRACRTSIKAGERLSDAEMRELIRELRDSKTIPVCPHGRPVAIVLTKDELEKNFKRKV